MKDFKHKKKKKSIAIMCSLKSFMKRCFENDCSNSFFIPITISYVNQEVSIAKKKDKLEEGRDGTLDGKQVSLGCYALCGS